MPRWGAMSLSSNTQGDALGCRLVGPPGRPGSLGCVEHTYFFSARKVLKKNTDIH